MKATVVAPGEGSVLNVIGNQFTLQLTGAQTAGRLLLAAQVTPPGHGVPAHIHANEDEVFAVCEGQVEFVVGGRSFVAEPGTVVFAPRAVPHSLRVVSAAPARMSVTVVPAGLEQMFAELSALPPGPPDMRAVVEICGQFGITFV